MEKITDFKYVRHEELHPAIQQGWVPTPALEGTHHGYYSVLAIFDAGPEEWRSVPGYEGIYEASSYGRVRSLDRTIEKPQAKHGYPRRVAGRVLSQTLNKANGYYYLRLSNAEGVGTMMQVSHAVCLAFHGPRPARMQVCHNDGKKANNRPDNLRYASKQDNEADKSRHRTLKRGAELSSLTDDDVHQIRRLVVENDLETVAKSYGVKRATISAIASRRTWKHLPMLPGEVGTPDGDARRAEWLATRRGNWATELNQSRAGRSGR